MYEVPLLSCECNMVKSYFRPRGCSASITSFQIPSAQIVDRIFFLLNFAAHCQQVASSIHLCSYVLLYCMFHVHAWTSYEVKIKNYSLDLLSLRCLEPSYILIPQYTNFNVTLYECSSSKVNCSGVCIPSKDL